MTNLKLNADLAEQLLSLVIITEARGLSNYIYWNTSKGMQCLLILSGNKKIFDGQLNEENIEKASIVCLKIEQ